MSKIMSKIKSPQFSIITVVLNNKKKLEKTIKSVLGQKFKSFEYILIDGNLVDKTLPIIKKLKIF
jgi:glycosyltransferase involved in cell wall biosynthesis